MERNNEQSGLKTVCDGTELNNLVLGVVFMSTRPVCWERSKLALVAAHLLPSVQRRVAPGGGLRGDVTGVSTNQRSVEDAGTRQAEQKPNTEWTTPQADTGAGGNNL